VDGLWDWGEMVEKREGEREREREREVINSLD
jgi:hypothetical protein